ncbi:AcrR family transcriptional regulator [Nocardia sp. GAS34]|uniref:TetR/AcrR family transcriptional regulator n=1 Tax=unclassified Nocardia TaxID=2637762 RepID=UPI003D20829C
MPELAAEAGVGVATAYRHFPTPQDAMRAFHRRAIEQLLQAFTAAVAAHWDREPDPVERFHRFCATWVEQSMQWGPAVRYIRSSAGFIERLNDGDEAITDMHAMLADVLVPSRAREGPANSTSPTRSCCGSSSSTNTSSTTWPSIAAGSPRRSRRI